MEAMAAFPCPSFNYLADFSGAHTVKDREQSVREAVETCETFVSEV